MTRSPAPTLRTERSLLRSGVTSLGCVDEAGRGALSGPVSVGIVVVTPATQPAPRGVRDSKLLSEAKRRELEPLIMEWADHAVGMASAAEIDRLGIIAAMRMAGRRALSALPTQPDLLLLDGKHDYLSAPAQPSLFAEGPDLDGVGSPVPPSDLADVPPVQTMVKADLRCAGVAAASILAKTARDRLMAELHEGFPEYGWAGNKGYGAAEHLDALAQLGPTPHHRVSWTLPSPG